MNLSELSNAAVVNSPLSFSSSQSTNNFHKMASVSSHEVDSIIKQFECNEEEEMTDDNSNDMDENQLRQYKDIRNKEECLRAAFENEIAHNANHQAYDSLVNSTNQSSLYSVLVPSAQANSMASAQSAQYGSVSVGNDAKSRKERSLGTLTDVYVALIISYNSIVF